MKTRGPGRPATAINDLVAAMRELGDAVTVEALARRLRLKPASVLVRLRRAVKAGAVCRTCDGYAVRA